MKRGPKLRRAQNRFKPRRVKQVAKKKVAAGPEKRTFAALWDDEDLFRGRVLYFAARGITADIYVTTVGVERIEDIAGLTRDRFGGGKFGGCRRRPGRRSSFRLSFRYTFACRRRTRRGRAAGHRALSLSPGRRGCRRRNRVAGCGDIRGNRSSCRGGSRCRGRWLCRLLIVSREQPDRSCHNVIRCTHQATAH